MTLTPARIHNLALIIAATALLMGCGSEDKTDASRPRAADDTPAPLVEAQQVTAADFPATAGRTLEELASEVRSGPNVAAAVSNLVPGENRLAFGIFDDEGRVVYGKSALYVARSPDAAAQGPFPAPADTLITKPEFRSRFAATERDPYAAIYAADVSLPKAGRYAVLAVTRQGGQLIGGTLEVRVPRKSAVPALGARAPVVSTDTLTSAKGDVKAIETRIPPDDMHDVDFKDVVGRKPVALLFATPALCESRTCGPVTDILLQLKKDYGDRLAFIHQEVFVDNDPRKGYRRPLRQFGLTTEPWLFTINARGRVTARLEGAFGVNAARRALDAALK